MVEPVRVLVCGSRDWTARNYLFGALDFLNATGKVTCVIEGEAPGADTFARQWAMDRNIPFDAFEAHWEDYGRAAGPIRNTEMILVGKPELVVAFTRDLSNSRGTANMVAQARTKGIPVIVLGEVT